MLRICDSCSHPKLKSQALPRGRSTCPPEFQRVDDKGAPYSSSLACSVGSWELYRRNRRTAPTSRWDHAITSENETVVSIGCRCAHLAGSSFSLLYAREHDPPPNCICPRRLDVVVIFRRLCSLSVGRHRASRIVATVEGARQAVDQFAPHWGIPLH